MRGKGSVLIIGVLLLGLTGTALAGKVPGKSAASPPKVPGVKVIMEVKNTPRWKSKWDLARSFANGKKYDQALALYREVLGIKPNLQEARLEMAHILRYMGKNAEAIEALEIVLESVPERTDALLVLAELLETDGNEKRAIKIYEEILLKDPVNLVALKGLGRIHFKLKSCSGALTYYYQALKQDPKDLNLIYAVAICLDSLGKPDEAIAYYRGLISFKGDDAVFVHRYADALISAGQESEALTVLGTFLKGSPNNLPGHEKMARLYLKRDRKKEALPHLKELLGKNGGDPRLFFKIGQIERELALYPDAVSTLQALLKLEPRHKEGMLTLAEVFSASGQFSAAIEQYKTYLTLVPQDREALKRLTELYLKTDQYPAAAKGYEELCRAYPEKTGFKLALAEVWLKMGEQGKALESTREVLSLDPKNKEALVRKAEILQALGKVEEAIPAWQLVVEFYPGLLPAKLALADLLMGQAQVAAAQKLFCAVLADDDKNIAALRGLSRTCELRNELDLALDAYTKILAAYPDDQEAPLGLARVHKGLKNYEEAGKCYARLLAENPGRLEALLDLGCLARLSGDYQKSQAIYLDILSKNPGLEAARNGLAQVYLDRGCADFAWAEYQKMILSNPGSAAAVQGLALFYLKDDESRKAEKLLREYLSAFSGTDQERLLLGRILTMRREWEEAANTYQSLLKKPEVASEARIGLAGLYQGRKQYPQAIAVYRAAWEEAPYSLRALLGLKKCLAKLGDTAFSQKVDGEIERLSRHRPDLFWEQDFLESDYPDWPAKVALYRKIKDNHPRHLLAGWFLAQALEHVDGDQALKEYEDWAGRYPDNDRGLLNLARIYVRKLAFSKALANYNKLLALDPANSLYQAEKIQLFFDWGRGDEALGLLKTFLIPHVDDRLEEKLRKIAADRPEPEIKSKLARFLSKRSEHSVYHFYKKFSREVMKRRFPEQLLPALERIRLDLYGDYVIQKKCHDRGGSFNITPRN